MSNIDNQKQPEFDIAGRNAKLANMSAKERIDALIRSEILTTPEELVKAQSRVIELHRKLYGE
jgi:hypothetical protein